ncbi:hypothetical protein KQ51_01388 [Candidatus Izimaplasma bacterium HR1]|jgi:predicted metal-dependent hydrolase|uniref:hypothetical protein n=1 Tax=Candidatus Izimoplasma sp. HR1 TaxID=1541959 RepID=UPI0004F59C31|nr:hypothetical protein KQ51_01388 [Candidatus Izimaplasma bacterium HR1]
MARISGGKIAKEKTLSQKELDLLNGRYRPKGIKPHKIVQESPKKKYSKQDKSKYYLKRSKDMSLTLDQRKYAKNRLKSLLKINKTRPRKVKGSITVGMQETPGSKRVANSNERAYYSRSKTGITGIKIYKSGKLIGRVDR